MYKSDSTHTEEMYPEVKRSHGRFLLQKDLYAKAYPNMNVARKV